MKKIIILCITSILMLTGCTDKQVSKDAFRVMCANDELAICGDKQGLPYTYTPIEEIQEYAEVLFDDNYVYKYDPSSNGIDYYNYMYGSPMEGDCEDVVITLLEDLIMLGMVDKGEAKWIAGTYNNSSKHAWLEITKDGVTYLFDTSHLAGIERSSTDKYRNEFVVYSY